MATPSSYFLNKSLCEPVRVSVNMSASPEILMWFRFPLIVQHVLDHCFRIFIRLSRKRLLPQTCSSRAGRTGFRLAFLLKFIHIYPLQNINDAKIPTKMSVGSTFNSKVMAQASPALPAPKCQKIQSRISLQDSIVASNGTSFANEDFFAQFFHRV